MELNEQFFSRKTGPLNKRSLLKQVGYLRDGSKTLQLLLVLKGRTTQSSKNTIASTASGIWNFFSHLQNTLMAVDSIQMARCSLKYFSEQFFILFLLN